MKQIKKNNDAYTDTLIIQRLVEDELKQKKQKSNKILGLNIEYGVLTALHMFLILGSFISTMYAYLTLGKLTGAVVWFVASFMSMIIFSYSMIQNQHKIDEKINKINNNNNKGETQ
jgi:hypothetical protein